MSQQGREKPLKSLIPTASSMKGKMSYLTAVMFTVLILVPFLERGTLQLSILNLLISAVFIFGIYVASYNRRTLLIALGLGVPWSIISWLQVFGVVTSFSMEIVSNVLLVLFYVLTATVVMTFVLKNPKVTKDTLYGAICVYMFIGGTWATIFTLIESVTPGSFYIAESHNLDGQLDIFDFLYLSYVTLTTLGYGDITPISSLARLFVMLEAIVGVMYMTVIISRLVGLHARQDSQTRING